MQDLNDLFYFVQVVEHQGSAPAGRMVAQFMAAHARVQVQLEAINRRVVFPSRRGLLPSVRQLIDFLATRFKELADEDSSIGTRTLSVQSAVSASG